MDAPKHRISSTLFVKHLTLFALWFILPCILVGSLWDPAPPPPETPVEPLQLPEPEERTLDTRADSAAVLWLARASYSETKRPEEQELVAWVVRNRYEAQYRGSSYREVVLAPKQFSAFNHWIYRNGRRAGANHKRDYYLSLDWEDARRIGSWANALRIAEEVYLARDGDRPLPSSVLWFWSPQSMIPEGRTPDWGKNATIVVDLGDRFKFIAHAQGA